MSANVFLSPSPVTPPFLLISNITNAVKAVMTVTTPNNYIVNQLVKFTVPKTYGMYQVNNLTVQIIAVDETNLIFTLALDTTMFDVFITPSTYQEQPATVACAGSRNIYNTTVVPFRAVNGQVGN